VSLLILHLSAFVTRLTVGCRIVEPYSGELLIDGVNVLTIPLHSLRSNIAIVPQDPTLFQASVRFNLDPFNQHSDDAIWAALRSVHLDAHVANMDSVPTNTAAGGVSPVETPRSTGTASEGGDSGDVEIGLNTSICSSTYESISRLNSDSNGHLWRGNLDEKMVAEKGANFSVGQRQLLCLARAILR